MQPESSVGLVALLGGAMIGVAVLVGAGSVIVPDVVSWLRRIRVMLTPPPM
jgi:serine acetyltransferase